MYNAAHHIAPLVTIIITAKDRPQELALTLATLSLQNYPNLEVIVVDDASEPSLEPIVHSSYPSARLVRNLSCKGLIANRTLAMSLAHGAYLISLDDDSCFTDVNDIQHAVARMEAEPDLGVLTFCVFHGITLPDTLLRPKERYVTSYIGCGHLLSRRVYETVGGYRDFYFYYGEEAEYSLRVLDAGWRILSFPSVLIHHRVSNIGRVRSSIQYYSFRNNLFTIILNMPFRRAVIQGTWRFVSHTLECFRHLAFHTWVRAIKDISISLPHLFKERSPIKSATVQLYDSLTVYNIHDYTTLQFLPPPTFAKTVASFWKRFISRPRARAFWDSESGNLGTTEGSYFSHEHQNKK